MDTGSCNSGGTIINMDNKEETLIPKNEKMAFMRASIHGQVNHDGQAIGLVMFESKDFGLVAFKPGANSMEIIKIYPTSLEEEIL